MFSAKSKTIVAAIVLTAFAACGNGDRESAAALLQESRVEIDKHSYTRALELLDTLNSRYREQTEVRREALSVRAEAMEGIAIDSIAAGDSVLAKATLRVQNLESRFRHIDSSVGLDGYYISRGATDKVLTSTGIQPRLTNDGHFYIVANVQGRSIGLNAVRFEDQGESMQSAVISPERVLKVEGSEIASFSPEDLEGVGQWLIAHDGGAKCRLVGSKGKAEVALNKQLKEQLVDCAAYSAALQAKRQALLHREKYERMLAAARDQLANLQQAPQSNGK